MALGTIRGAGGNHEALHAQLGDAVQDAKQGVLFRTGVQLQGERRGPRPVGSHLGAHGVYHSNDKQRPN